MIEKGLTLAMFFFLAGCAHSAPPPPMKAVFVPPFDQRGAAVIQTRSGNKSAFHEVCVMEDRQWIDKQTGRPCQ